ncbi:MAG: DMT family transporter [Desulfobacterales bacterium]|jgi:drug/metabolite transporter (DMT)-like permease
MKTGTVKSDALLLSTAIIWGFAFVAQRVGMEYVGPFTFNGIRFAIGSFSLLPLVILSRDEKISSRNIMSPAGLKIAILGGGALGLALFAGASLQQIGLVYTTAGKAGFITGLYVIIVPILGLFWRQQPKVGTWMGAFLAAIGLYFLSVTEQFTIDPGDLLVLIGAFFWAAHVLIIGWLSPRINPIKLAFSQYLACSILSLITAAAIEDISMASISQAAIPILYGGLLSVGVAYTLQVVAQRDAHPAHAAVLLSMEAVFAAIGGWLILDEVISARGLFGCALMLAGMLLSQLWGLMNKISVTSSD